jgi:hypothetical protein
MYNTDIMKHKSLILLLRQWKEIYLGQRKGGDEGGEELHYHYVNINNRSGVRVRAEEAEGWILLNLKSEVPGVALDLNCSNPKFQQKPP